MGELRKEKDLRGAHLLNEHGRATWAARNIASASALATSPYKADFPLLRANPELAFLDSAATAQRPRAVIEAQARFAETLNANALRGLYRLSVEATAAINEARAHVARFLGFADAKPGSIHAREIVFTRNASESLNLVAKTYGSASKENGGAGLGPGDEVCITIMEHHSNLVPWQQVCARTGAKLVYMYPDEDCRIDEAEMRAKIGPNTKIVASTQVSNVLGVANDVAKMAEIAHEFGAVMVVDGAQSVPHFPVNVAELGVDFFAFSAHKVFGPFGIGVLWGRMELLEAMPPFLTGGEMIERVTEQTATWAPVPEKFEAGTQDATGIYALDAALTYLEGLGWGAVEAREQALVALCMRKLEELEFVRIIGPEDPADHHGVVSFNVCGIHPHDVASILDMENVAIRAGNHCAQPLLAHLGVESCCRASLAFYNDAADIERLVRGLKTVWAMFN